MKLSNIPGSFRDPAGQVFEYENKIYRVVKKEGKQRLETAISKNIINESISNNFLIDTKIVNNQFEKLIDDNNCYFLEHQKLDYISYPYEWGFYQLKDAALHHLNFQIFLLEKNFVLIDSSAYNIQFLKNKPIFIDVLSIEKYNEGEFWKGHSQFLQQFLNPLLLSSLKGLQFNDWYKGNLDGIKTSELNELLNLKDKLSINILLSIVLLSKFEKENKINPKKALNKLKSKKKLSKNSYKSMLVQLKNWIKKLEPKERKTIWDTYSVENTYKKEQEEKKLEVINNFSKKYKPNILADIGCNDGMYSFESIKAGALKVVGFDIDINSIDRAYKISLEKNLNFLPLYFNAMNPSSKLGWNETERYSFKDRINFDAMIALAFEHHLALGNNVPLDQTVFWLMNIAKRGLIEFVDKEDETVKRMLSLKGDIFPDYTQSNFENKILENGTIVDKIQLSDTRIVYEYSKN